VVAREGLRRILRPVVAVLERSGGIDRLLELFAGHDDAEIALKRDFQEFYTLDLSGVWAGTLRPRRALELIGGLFEIPRSRYAALIRDDESFGWGVDTHLLADIDDTLTAIIFGLAGKKATTSDLQKRPTPPPDDEAKAAAERSRARRVADFDVAWFLGQLNS
jgi:hypothetical protein